MGKIRFVPDLPVELSYLDDQDRVVAKEFEHTLGYLYTRLTRGWGKKMRVLSPKLGPKTVWRVIVCLVTFTGQPHSSISSELEAKPRPVHLAKCVHVNNLTINKERPRPTFDEALEDGVFEERKSSILVRLQDGAWQIIPWLYWWKHSVKWEEGRLVVLDKRLNVPHRDRDIIGGSRSIVSYEKSREKGRIALYLSPFDKNISTEFSFGGVFSKPVLVERSEEGKSRDNKGKYLYEGTAALLVFLAVGLIYGGFWLVVDSKRFWLIGFVFVGVGFYLIWYTLTTTIGA